MAGRIARYLIRRAGVAQHDQHVAAYHHAQIAVYPFRGVQKQRRRPRARKRGRHLAPHRARLPDSRHHHPALGRQNQLHRAAKTLTQAANQPTHRLRLDLQHFPRVRHRIIAPGSARAFKGLLFPHHNLAYTIPFVTSSPNPCSSRGLARPCSSVVPVPTFSTAPLLARQSRRFCAICEICGSRRSAPSIPTRTSRPLPRTSTPNKEPRMNHTSSPNLPAGLRDLRLQITSPEREALWDYAAARGYGVEVFDFTDPDLLDDPARVRALLDWYRARRAEVTGALSLHGAYRNLRPGAADSKIRAASRDRIEQSLDLAEELGACQVVFHCGFELMAGPAELPAWVRAVCRLLAERAGRANAGGVSRECLRARSQDRASAPGRPRPPRASGPASTSATPTS